MLVSAWLARLGSPMRLLAPIFCVFLSFAVPASANDWHATGQVRVVDGDTIKFGTVTVRLAGIDAPEKGQQCSTAQGKPWDCGAGSTKHLLSLIKGNPVTCHGDSFDRYKRHIAVCYVLGVDLNTAMVRGGWALDYRQFSHGKYAESESDARNAKRGMWAGGFMKPWDWRKTKPEN